MVDTLVALDHGRPGLLSLLSNDLVLRQTAPYLGPTTLLRLACTSKDIRQLVKTSSIPFTYLDLRQIRSAIVDSVPIDVGGQSFRAERMDEALTEDEFYCGPLRGIFSRLGNSRLNVLGHVQVLILDGLSVPADLMREILSEDRFNVRMLSIRKCTHLNERKLCQVLKYAVRPGRKEGTPKLRGLYYFGPQDSTHSLKSAEHGRNAGSVNDGVMGAEGAQIGGLHVANQIDTSIMQLGLPEDRWYRSMGRVIKPPISDWAEVLSACSDIIAFDAVMCRGPRHDPQAGEDYLPPAIATVALGPGGCDTCATCPERPVVFGRDGENYLPLLAPPPLHTTSVKSAQATQAKVDADGSRHHPKLFLRCEACLRGRWCERCNRWWCETCYPQPISREANQSTPRRASDAGVQAVGSTRVAEPSAKQIGVHRDCFGCGRTCAECKTRYIRRCRNCQQEYCIVDNKGLGAYECDWCSYSGRRTRELY